MANTEEQVNNNEQQVKKQQTQAKKTKLKLKDPNTFYGEGSFVLSGKNQMELPPNPSAELLARIKSGFIVEVK